MLRSCNDQNIVRATDIQWIVVPFARRAAGSVAADVIVPIWPQKAEITGFSRFCDIVSLVIQGIKAMLYSLPTLFWDGFRLNPGLSVRVLSSSCAGTLPAALGGSKA